MRAHLTILAILTTSDAIGSPPLIRRLDSRTIHRGEFFFNSVSSNLLDMDRVIADFAAVSREKKENGKKLHEHENRTRQCCQIWRFLHNYRKINKRTFFWSDSQAGSVFKDFWAPKNFLHFKIISLSTVKKISLFIVKKSRASIDNLLSLLDLPMIYMRENR